MYNLIIKVNSIKINEKSKLITKGLEISAQIIPMLGSNRGQIIVASQATDPFPGQDQKIKAAALSSGGEADSWTQYFLLV